LKWARLMFEEENGGRMADRFNPGDKVERSGIYRVVHDPHHSQEHEVTSVFRKLFVLRATTVGTTRVSF
jgi:hypothetical protein